MAGIKWPTLPAVHQSSHNRRAINMTGVKSLYFLGLVLMGLAAIQAADAEQVVGGVSQLEGDRRKEALTLLDTTLSQLATGDGPDYKAVNVTSVTGQTVSGTKYTYEVELNNGSDKKQCTVQIWSQPWLPKDGTNIKIKCAGDEGELDRTW
ncbi:cystatin-like protein [Drosophila biarmipes]|uniref:cystatin-like protein n=1 Tax=Drosophila biarmipes TaxID=125945 RepID=UPI0007E82BB4|nr:cystatin-like protein [Drosophila biarmipes]